jgi:hypothetical protein
MESAILPGPFRDLDAELALGRFQVFSSAPVHVDDFMVLIDDDASRRVIFQQPRFHRLRQTFGLRFFR